MGHTSETVEGLVRRREAYEMGADEKKSLPSL